MWSISYERKGGVTDGINRTVCLLSLAEEREKALKR